MKVRELQSTTSTDLLSKVDKLDRIIRSHPQRSMRARAGGTKAIILGELARRNQPH